MTHLHKKLIYFGITTLLVILVVLVGWRLFMRSERTYGQFLELQNLDLQPILIEENNNLFIQWETSEPIVDNMWIEVGYNGNIYAGSKILNHEESGVYFNKEHNGGYQHRVLAAWSMPKQKNEIQFQIIDKEKNLASKIFILNYSDKEIK